MMKKLIIALDGNSGCGKSSTAKELAARLGYIYIDTGAMYRAVALHMLKHGINYNDRQAVISQLPEIDITFKYSAATKTNNILLNGRKVDKEIRTMAVTSLASPVSAISEVRKKLVDQQRKLGAAKGVVMDGRDIGTVVFPDADLKIFMTASPEIRAERRVLEMKEKGMVATYDEVLQNLQERDDRDSSRDDSPLMAAEDAIELDTSHMTFDEQVNFIFEKANKLIVE